MGGHQHIQVFLAQSVARFLAETGVEVNADRRAAVSASDYVLPRIFPPDFAQIPNVGLGGIRIQSKFVNYFFRDNTGRKKSCVGPCVARNTNVLRYIKSVLGPLEIESMSGAGCRN